MKVLCYNQYGCHHRSRQIKIASCLDSWISIPGAFRSSILGCGGIGLGRKIWSPLKNFNMNQHEVWIYAEPRRNSLLPAAGEREAWRPRAYVQYQEEICVYQLLNKCQPKFTVISSVSKVGKFVTLSIDVFTRKIMFIVTN